ncbi:unnamed protein product [Ostreobium quekettii]|uniref:Ribosome biogenesis protein BMS1/TSR1 C-terminal domain-containing protein n=1 Tax=Ostreobium quekettii TaxID=121088 RepID=A0A8S1J185_9CHLO|nr:unnamed protein product [Ostreobium quekettii]
MLARASRLFGRSGPDLQTAVYGRKATAPEGGETDDEASSGDEDELFRPVGSESSRSRWKDGQETKNGLDSSRVVFPLDIVQKWEGEGSAEVLRNRFVTGSWEEGRRRSEARPGTSDGSDDGTSDGGDVYGDFEDVETGEMFGGPKDAVTEMAQRAIHEVEMERKKEKAAKKAVFDVEYDEEGAGGVADAPVGGAQECDSSEKEPTFYHTVKQEMMEKLAHTRSALDALDPVQRVALEGFRPGTYIRMRLSGVPAEMVEEFDSERPLLVGGMGPGEDKLGFMRLRFKKHRWAPRVLKTRDPLVFSVGWRRFQSLPTYAIEDHNRRLRMLKYTPEHMHCVAVAWGPLCPPNTGILGIQNLSSDLQNWRISGTGVVTELKADFQVMKKLKLVGHPFKVHKNTAFISGMFNSSLEVSKFEGASVKTVSGIRGTIKKAVREGSSQGAPDGTFRATFEDKLLASDIIFLRAWVTVELPRYCNPVTNMMYRQETVGRKILRASAAHEEAAGDIIESKETEELAPNFSAAPNFEGERIGYVFKTGDLGLGYYRDSHYVTPARRSDAEGASSAAWKGMRTVAELRRLLGVGVVTDQDSAYRPIERAPRIFPSMKIPKTILKNLPYKSRVKVMALNGQKDKTPIIQTDEEKKLRGTIRQLRAIRSERDKKRKLQKERQRQKLEKRQAEEEAWRAKYNREERKKRYRAEAEKEQAKAKRGKMQRR